MKKILLMAFLVLASSGGMLAQSKKSVRAKQQTESTKTKTPAKSSRKMVKKGMVPSTHIPVVKGKLIPSAKIKTPAPQKVVTRKTTVSTSSSKPLQSERQLGKKK